MDELDLTIPTLGAAEKDSPLGLSTVADDLIADYTPDDARVLLNPVPGGGDEAFEVSGPRQKLYFEGAEVTAGLVTCGGLCPGLNNVIRAIVLTLWERYGVREILGFRYGYRGLSADSPDPPAVLTPDKVRTIHHHGGTVLGSSRGAQEPPEMVDTLQRVGVNALFVIGGDGTMRGAHRIFEEIGRRNARIAVVGLPKTIDNDLPFIERTFGFDTAVTSACEAIRAARVEASGAPNGVGVVKLMGRHAGFIAASATLASREVDMVLVPELPFALEGERGVLPWLRRRLDARGQAVIVVAEGAGQRHLESSGQRDASGNVKLSDIGVFMRDRIKAGLRDVGVNVKYIDPSYIIRAQPANAADAIFCGRVAEDAVHAAMAGKTGLIVGLWNNQFTHVPLAAVIAREKKISLDGTFWRSVMDCTGQPSLLE